MKIIVDRFKSNAEATLAQVTVYSSPDHAAMGLYVCEDAYHVPKIPGRTRIPAGSYQLTLRKEGGLYTRYCANPKLGGIGQERGMIWVRNIPGFEWVYFHIGNTHKDSEGCPLVGMGHNLAAMSVTESVKAYRKFYPLVADAIEAGAVTAEFIDNDR